MLASSGMFHGMYYASRFIIFTSYSAEVTITAKMMPLICVCIVFVCSLVGYPPFTDDRTDMPLVKQIIEGHYDMPEKYWANVSAHGKRVL